MIVNRIQHTYSGSTLPFFAERNGKDIDFEQERQLAEYHKRATRDWRLLMIDYQVCRMRLVTLNNDKNLVSQVSEALKTAKILEKIYRDYLVISSEAERYRIEIEQYEQWLRCEVDLTLSYNKQSTSAKVRSWTLYFNFPRLLSVRSRRAFITLRPFAEGSFLQFIKDFDESTRWFATYQAWVFFLPRLLSNLIFFCQHVFEHPWMSQAEKDLGFEARLVAQLDRRWVELANDISWFTSGLISCFVLTGTWGVWGVYLNAVTQFLDIIFAIIRISNERHRFKELERSYQNLNQDIASEQKEIQAHLEMLTMRLNVERQLLWLALVNPIVLTIGACLLCCTSTPILPFVGGIVLVAMTLGNYFGTQYIRAQIPAVNVRDFLLANPRVKEAKPSLGSSKSDGSILIYRSAEDEAAATLEGRPARTISQDRY